MTLVKTVNEIEGIHWWKDAPEHLWYLKNEHRHIFKIICYWNVQHSDRQVEIIETQQKVRRYLENKYYYKKYNLCVFENRSCEQIAQELMEHFGCYAVEVTEDGYGGAYVQSR